MPSSALEIEATGASWSLTPIYQTTWGHIQSVRHFDPHGRHNFRSRLLNYLTNSASVNLPKHSVNVNKLLRRGMKVWFPKWRYGTGKFWWTCATWLQETVDWVLCVSCIGYTCFVAGTTSLSASHWSSEWDHTLFSKWTPIKPPQGLLSCYPSAVLKIVSRQEKLLHKGALRTTSGLFVWHVPFYLLVFILEMLQF
jgi:hypothetical protein